MGIFKKSRTEKKGRQVLSDGNYIGIVKSVMVKEGKYGEYLEVTFSVGGNGIEKRVVLDTWVGERNKTRRFLEALGIRNNFESVEEKDLIGRYCVIELKTVEKAGRKVQIIVDFKEVK